MKRFVRGPTITPETCPWAVVDTVAHRTLCWTVEQFDADQIVDALNRSDQIMRDRVAASAPRQDEDDQ
jgi:hypothetical protein